MVGTRKRALPTLRFFRLVSRTRCSALPAMRSIVRSRCSAEPGPHTFSQASWTPDQQRTANALRCVRGTDDQFLVDQRAFLIHGVMSRSFAVRFWQLHNKIEK